MVNNLMSGLLGGVGNQPGTSTTSSSASSGTSTTATATPAGTSQPGPANSSQPGMPRTNIRIENPPGGLAGFFPGRMPMIPGWYNSITHISLASHFWDIGKQCRPRSDDAECGIWSGSSLFPNRNIYSK